MIEFTDDYIEPIFQKQAPAIFYFREGDNEDHKAQDEVFGKAAVENKGKLLFATSGVSEGIQVRVAEYLGIEKDTLPTVIIIGFEPSGISKFRFSGDHAKFSSDEITAFVDNWKAGKLEKFLKTEEIPETNDEPVKVVVGKNFNELVRDSDDDVLLEFYAPWCGHCK